MRAAAFFDLDRTLIRINSGTRWVAFQRRRGEIGLGLLVKSVLWAVQYRLAIFDMETVGTKLVRGMEGDSEADLQSATAIFLRQEVLPAVTDKARAAIDEHSGAARELVLLTSSTQYVAEPFAKELGIPHVLCSRLHVADGRFVGTYEPPFCYGPGKVHYAERFAAAHGIDLAQSYFYTDSYSDLPMLERVGEPRVINPDRRLRRLARQRGWPVEMW